MIIEINKERTGALKYSMGNSNNNRDDKKDLGPFEKPPLTPQKS